MNALQLVAPRTLEFAPMPDPRDPGPGEVLVRIRACGVCGSDMHFYLEGGCAGTGALYPSVLGHEPAGEIVELGRGVEGLVVGQRVAVEPALTCGHCSRCRAGYANQCEVSRFMGGVQEAGLLRDYAVVPAHNAVPLPDDVDYATATVVEPLAVLLHSVNLAKLHVGETVAVMGAGPIGLLAVATAKLAGASRVIVGDRIPHRLAMAKKLGADEAVNIDNESVRDAVHDLTGGKGAHVVFDGAGKAESINNAIASARRGGRVVIIGIPSEHHVGVDLWQAMHSELSIHVQKRSNGNDRDALDILRRGEIDASLLITHRFSLEQGARAFETVAEYADGVGKALVEW
jgi:L-iditol 2-dehydrogenase